MPMRVAPPAASRTAPTFPSINPPPWDRRGRRGKAAATGGSSPSADRSWIGPSLVAQEAARASAKERLDLGQHGQRDLLRRVGADIQADRTVQAVELRPRVGV